MLKAHQACIDLEKNVLRIRGREVKFLAEHELPEKARLMEVPIEDTPASTSGNQPTASGSQPQQRFPGHGSTLGAVPAPAAAPARGHGHREEDIQTLMNLGASREMAINALNMAGGNVEYAASMLF